MDVKAALAAHDRSPPAPPRPFGEGIQTVEHLGRAPGPVTGAVGELLDHTSVDERLQVARHNCFRTTARSGASGFRSHRRVSYETGGTAAPGDDNPARWHHLCR